MKQLINIITHTIHTVKHTPITRPLSGRVIASTSVPFRLPVNPPHPTVPVRAHYVSPARHFASQSGMPKSNKNKQLVSKAEEVPKPKSNAAAVNENKEAEEVGDDLPKHDESDEIFGTIADFFRGFLAAIYGDAATVAAVVWKTMEAMAVMLATEHVLKRSYRFLKNVVSLYLEKGIAKYELGPGRMLYVFEMPNVIKGTANAWLDMQTNILYVRGLHPKDGKVKFLTRKVKIIGCATQLKATHFVKLNVVAVDVKDFDSNRKTEMKIDDETGDLESIVGRKVSTEEEGEESQETSN